MTSAKKNIRSRELLYNWQLWVVASLTLGLAPFYPEPHIWGKLTWIIGSGGEGMSLLDFFDFLWHGFPWIMLGISIYLTLERKRNESYHT